MKATELRIGNYVMYEPTIDDWEEKVITLHSLLQVDISPESYCGIPLTEEWLLKFGFKKTLKSMNTFTLFNHEEGEVWFEVCGADGYEWYRPHDIFPRIKHVHQLQNLYFALNGEELEIKDKWDA